MGRYASSTDVDVGRSRNEIERVLARYGAEQFMFGWNERSSVVEFIDHGRRVRFLLPLPPLVEFRVTTRGRARKDAAAQRAREQAIRQRWRALLLVIKAKLEAVDAGITTFESEFLAHLVLPNGQTVGQWAAPQLASVYDSGAMPPMLPETSEVPRG